MTSNSQQAELPLTSDNLLLSRTTPSAIRRGIRTDLQSTALNVRPTALGVQSTAPASQPISPDVQSTALDLQSTALVVESSVAALIHCSISENTRKAYAVDLAHYESWGGRIPASETMIASYLAAHAGSLSVATLVRRLASISKAHGFIGAANPVRHGLVKATLRGIKRRSGTAQRAAKPLLKDDLLVVLDAMGGGLRDARDQALLLIGFAGGFRRSELVNLDRSDIEPVRQGIVVRIRRSKTDQTGAGRTLGISYGRDRRCPVGALENWFERSKVNEGPVFRPVDRHGHVAGDRLSGEAVSLIVKERLAAAGYAAAGYSGHSLRAGFVTSAAQAGIPSWRIRAQTGHVSDAMLARYIRNGQLFTDNPAGVLL